MNLAHRAQFPETTCRTRLYRTPSIPDNRDPGKRGETARANGAKSHGPVTLRGKINASKNSQRHGLLANTVVLDNESSERFTDLVSAITRQFRPATEVEYGLIETMAVCRWRQARVWAMETANFNHEIRTRLAADPALDAFDETTRSALAFRSLADTSRSLELLGRYESRFDRQFNRALKRLTDLQTARLQRELQARSAGDAA